MKYRLSIALVVIASCVTGCFDLDSSLFNSTKLLSYTLPTTVIPESLRTQVVLSSQGKKIYGYYVRSNDVNGKFCVLYNHGNRDHLQYYWDRVALLYSMGFSVFIYDYQGYGMSEGESNEASIHSDAVAAYAYVASLGFADSAIAVYGFSLGGVPATYLASSVFTPRAFITESAFASASTLVQSGVLLDMPGTLVMDGKYDNAELIKNVSAPKLFLHGLSDTFIDYQKNAVVLFHNAPEPKTLIPVAGANHSEVPQKMGIAIYDSTITNFILHPN